MVVTNSFVFQNLQLHIVQAVGYIDIYRIHLYVQQYLSVT